MPGKADWKVLLAARDVVICVGEIYVGSDRAT